MVVELKAAVLVEDYFDERELIFPLYRLKELGFEVELVGPEVKEYHGKQGFRIAAAVKANPSRAEEYDLIWIPGGYAPDRLRRSREILELVRRAYLSGKVIAAVCHAPWVLISAGVIRGKKVAAFYAIHDDVKNAGGILVEDEAIRDGNLITGTGPEAMPKMFRLIKDALKIKEC